MKWPVKLATYVGLIIIYLYLFGIKSLEKFKEGGVMINQKTLTQASVQPKPGMEIIININIKQYRYHQDIVIFQDS